MEADVGIEDEEPEVLDAGVEVDAEDLLESLDASDEMVVEYRTLRDLEEGFDVGTGLERDENRARLSSPTRARTGRADSSTPVLRTPRIGSRLIDSSNRRRRWRRRLSRH